MKAVGIRFRTLPTILLTSRLLFSLLPSYATALSYSTQSSKSDGISEVSTCSHSYSYRTVQVQVVHRHGDRTPITPLKNEEYWKNQLVPEELLERVAAGTMVLRNGDTDNNNVKNQLEVHAAAGKGPFGKLTKLGLLGMIQVGTSLREELEESTNWSEVTNAAKAIATTMVSSSPSIGSEANHNDDGYLDQNRGLQQHGRIKLTPNDIKVYSTDFDRTIQSVQGLLLGFFPDANDDETTISIDCRDTTCWMIPDPQPRQTQEQKVLEQALARRPHILEKEALLRPLAVRCTRALLPLLGDGAFGVSFGVDESDDDNEDIQVLSWIQLTEITKCLRTRDMLPDSITEDDQEALSAHTAWKWFQSLRSPRLAHIAMRSFTQNIIRTMEQRDQEPPLIVYSGHDSSLIGLMCALHLEQPSVWPEYGAVLKLELLEKRKEHNNDALDGGEAPVNGNGSEKQHVDDNDDIEHVLRFFLNGQLLRSTWNDIPRDEISLKEFAHLASTVGNEATTNTT
ncbi:unnamed protein product [Pseudo-nitzschia multistriata]|uniref:Acid phosphatase n=1 Tax=Pseudo-nitzschia multistriata TaxID=183589 RepID=A0A448ZF67_9STRA|nr:unnamed protein product [Pseudo-nitzschia multistriata]